MGTELKIMLISFIICITLNIFNILNIEFKYFRNSSYFIDFRTYSINYELCCVILKCNFKLGWAGQVGSETERILDNLKNQRGGPKDNF